MTWDEKLHPRGDGGEFVDSWAAKVRARMGITPDRPPHALVMGYRRVGDHPTGAGREHDHGGTMPVSSHPDAGGLWIDPNRPGPKHAPAYRNDMGWLVGDLTPKRSRSSSRKEELREQRRGGLRGRPDEVELSTTQGTSKRFGGRGYTERQGSFGYGARGDMSADGPAQAFVGAMKRAQSRARQETGRQAKRRTPRGTVIENWMMG